MVQNFGFVGIILKMCKVCLESSSGFNSPEKKKLQVDGARPLWMKIRVLRKLLKLLSCIIYDSQKMNYLVNMFHF